MVFRTRCRIGQSQNNLPHGVRRVAVCMHLSIGNREELGRPAVCVNVCAMDVQAERHNTHALFCFLSVCLSLSLAHSQTHTQKQRYCVLICSCEKRDIERRLPAICFYFFPVEWRDTHYTQARSVDKSRVEMFITQGPFFQHMHVGVAACSAVQFNEYALVQIRARRVNEGRTHEFLDTEYLANWVRLVVVARQETKNFCS